MNIIETEQRYTSGVYPKREAAIVRGSGTRVWDAEGNEYLDCTSAQGVANLGHCHPAVAAALAEQSQRLISCPEIFYNDQRARLLERLAGLLSGGEGEGSKMDRFFLCNSGAEAVEGALKFARLSTKRTGVVATMRGFHGRTMGALSATWERKYRKPFAPLVPDYHHVPFNKLERMEQAIGDKTAAVLVEIVQGEGGVRPGDADYFQGLRRLCDERGALLVIDEVQTGFGRTGRWFAHQHMGIVPDIMALGKAIAGGYPMGAVALGTRVGKLPKGTHGSTFGGNPLACAASLAAIGAYEEDGLIERSAELGAYLLTRLQTLESPLLRQIRGLGLMVGIELKTRVTPLLRALMARGVLALPAGPTVLRLLPPLIITPEELDQAVEAIADALGNMTR
ncbi:MAG: aspartate aminotransferase family protein [Ardenticatenaceae bacterium]